jgi:hypothetical protein
MVQNPSKSVKIPENRSKSVQNRSKNTPKNQSILRRAGKDASADFAFHSQKSKKSVWPLFEIGRISGKNGAKRAKKDGNRCEIS